MNGKEKELVSFDIKNLISVRKRNIGLYIDKVDWDRIKSYVKDFFATSNQRWAISYSLFALFISSLITFLITPINNQYRSYILVLVGISFVSAWIVLFFAFKGKGQEEKENEKILKEFKIIEDKSSIEQPMIEENEQLLESINNWRVTKNEINNQGVNYRDIVIQRELFNYIEIKVKSNSKYWRAGIKLSDSDTNSPAPKLLTNRSILFHTGVTDNQIICYLYINGERIKFENNISHYNYENLIILQIERIKNKINCYINTKNFILLMPL